MESNASHKGLLAYQAIWLTLRRSVRNSYPTIRAGEPRARRYKTAAVNEAQTLNTIFSGI
jgi:hypothetical protein